MSRQLEPLNLGMAAAAGGGWEKADLPLKSVYTHRRMLAIFVFPNRRFGFWVFVIVLRHSAAGAIAQAGRVSGVCRKGTR